MIGTLVVMLPSSCSGGDLMIQHKGVQKVFVASPMDLILVAFYADCLHEVRPVLEGHRVAVTFNLVLEGQPAAPGSAADIDRLTTAVRHFFGTRVPAGKPSYEDLRHAWLRDPVRPEHGPPGRLVHLLDHQYTSAGLAWSRLKGADAESTAALREAARRLDCGIALALADVHEEWQGEDKHGELGPVVERGGGPEWTHDTSRFMLHACGKMPDDSVSEVLDHRASTLELRHWVGDEAPPEAVLSEPVSEDELCYTVASPELPPFQSRVRPYMGNEGGTVDLWYRRAAILIWPRDRAADRDVDASTF